MEPTDSGARRPATLARPHLTGRATHALTCVVALVAGLATACGSAPGRVELSGSVASSGAGPSGTQSATPSGSTPGTVATAATASVVSVTSGATWSSGATLRTVTAQALPGEPVDYGPRAGQALAVVGVAAGRTLAVQALPGPGQSRSAALPPLATSVVATGRARLVGSVVWDEVTAQGVRGWAEGSHLAVPAHATDLTAEVVERLGRRPVAETMLDLGTAVARAYVSTEPPSTVVTSVAPTVGDLGEITMDVVGLGDDSVVALRLHVFGTPGQGSFTLKSVEATSFCSRGVSPSGRCL